MKRGCEMNWTDWYIQQTNPAAYTVFWAGTGKRPGLAEIFGATCKRHREEIRNNITSHNALYRRLVGGGL